MRMKTAFSAIVPAVAVLACSGDAIDPVTGGPGSGGEGFSVIVVDDPDPGEPDLIGTVRGSLRVSLRNDAGALVDLGTQTIEVALHEDADTVVLDDLVRPPIDDYTAVQVRFEGIDVEVLSGSIVGDSTLTSDFVLDVGSAGLATVDVLVPAFSIDASTPVDIVIDLNSEAWVTGANLDDLVVAQSDLANAVRVDVD